MAQVYISNEDAAQLSIVDPPRERLWSASKWVMSRRASRLNRPGARVGDVRGRRWRVRHRSAAKKVVKSIKTGPRPRTSRSSPTVRVPMCRRRRCVVDGHRHQAPRGRENDRSGHGDAGDGNRDGARWQVRLRDDRSEQDGAVRRYRDEQGRGRSKQVRARGASRISPDGTTSTQPMVPPTTCR